MKNLSKVVIVDYQMGNVLSVGRALHRIQINHSLTADHNEILQADKIILVGVGHFQNGMKNLKSLDLIETLNEYALIKKKPVLGICLGMQLMSKISEEGHCKGLGWLDCEVKKFQVQDTIKFKVPHAGWNQIKQVRDCDLMANIPNFSEFYFVHSYYMSPTDQIIAKNTTDYSGSFVSAIQQENLYGVQYHPEKSHEVGLQLLKNFCNL